MNIDTHMNMHYTCDTERVFISRWNPCVGSDVVGVRIGL